MSSESAAVAPVDLAPLYGALATAQSAIQAVGKDGRNNHQKYAYTTSEAVIDAARTALAPQGLAAFRLKYDVPESSGNNFAINSTYMLVHSSGASLEFSNMWIASPGKGRPDDKAMAGALTTGLAYWLRDLLLIPRKDESEADQRDDRNHVQQRRQPAPNQRPPQQHRAVGAPKRPTMSPYEFSTACKEMSLDPAMVIAWRDEAKPDDADKWGARSGDFRRGALIAKMRELGRYEYARSIEPSGAAAWALFDALTGGQAGVDADAAGMPGVEAHEQMRGDWLTKHIEAQS